MEITSLPQWMSPSKHPFVIAGPCSAETEEQVLKTAHELAQWENVQVMRAGLWKPRTRPHSFEGVGSKGLLWLKKVKEQTGLKVCTEVATAHHVEKALKEDVDLLWIGARTTGNPFSVEEIAQALKGVNIPLMIKNPPQADLNLWLGAFERMERAGVHQLAGIHRGFCLYGQSPYRNPPLWPIPMELKHRLPHLPLLCDPSHIAGQREKIAPLCQKALDMNMDGLMVEVHLQPERAWSDPKQQITPKELHKVISSLSPRNEHPFEHNFEEQLEEMRLRIDQLDEKIIETLGARFDLVKQIGRAKNKNQMTALQIYRMSWVLENRGELAQKIGLNQNFIKEIYQLIHEESLQHQVKMMKKSEENQHL